MGRRRALIAGLAAKFGEPIKSTVVKPSDYHGMRTDSRTHVYTWQVGTDVVVLEHKVVGDHVQVVYISDTYKVEYSTRSMAAFELESRHSKIAKDLEDADINRRKTDI
jgi:hypothetical protein